MSAPPSRFGAIVELFLLVRLEALRLARTPEILRFLLLPALLGLPVTVFLAVVVVSARGPSARVAIPPDLPPELALEAALAEADLAVVTRADPRAAWEAGEVDAAIVGWRAGDGVGSAESVEGADRAAWRIDVVADDVATSGTIGAVARKAGEEALADVVALSGGDPARDAKVASVVTAPLPKAPLPFSIPAAITAYCAFGLSLVAFFFLALPQVADRRAGVTESLRVLPIPMSTVLWARLLALWGLQLVVGLLLAGNVALLLSPVLSGEDFAAPGAWQLVAIAACTLPGSAGYVVVGVLASTAKSANNTSSFVMSGQAALLLWGLLGRPPVFVPLAGLLVADTVLERVVALAACVVFAHVLVATAGAIVERNVRYVLRRGDE